MSLGADEQLLQDVINVCCCLRNDMYEMFCTRTLEQLASSSVYQEIERNLSILQQCRSNLEQTSEPSGLSHIYMLSVHRMVCNVLLISALTLCETYVSATGKFRENRDAVGYKRALFTHEGRLHHADLDYHCACHGMSEGGGQHPLLTSTFLDRCAVAISRAYNIHSYVDVSTRGGPGQSTVPLADLIRRMMQITGVMYCQPVLPPDLVDTTKSVELCKRCSRDAVINGTMTLCEPDASCTCTVSVYTGTNTDGGRHTSLVAGRHFLLDTTLKSMCMQASLCDCQLHKETFASALKQLSDALTGAQRVS